MMEIIGSFVFKDQVISENKGGARNGPFEVSALIIIVTAILNNLENKCISRQVSSFSMYTLGYTADINTNIIAVSGC